MARTVWILGAGFSRSLGGPLLNELLTASSQAKVRAAFPRSQELPGRPIYGGAPELVYRLYANHGPNAGLENRHWDDAEAFLETLDTAAMGPPGCPSSALAARLIKSTAAGSMGNAPLAQRLTVKEVAAAAKRLVAAECCAFLHGIDTKIEKWQPYRRWARTLPSGDTVVTFNYDRVVETAAATGGVIEAFVPGQHPGEFAGDVPLLKLHGSVDWERVDGKFRKSDRPDFAVDCSDDSMVIASPGPTKKVVADALNQLWEQASIRIVNAEVIVFVGYRFPPSDSQARRKIVDALIANQAPHLTLRTVLGPSTTNPDTLRLKAILEYAMHSGRRVSTDLGPGHDTRSYTLKLHPLGAEDFLDLFEVGHLNDRRF